MTLEACPRCHGTGQVERFEIDDAADVAWATFHAQENGWVKAIKSVREMIEPSPGLRESKDAVDRAKARRVDAAR